MASSPRPPRVTLLLMPRWVNLPNCLTLLRLALAPVVIEAIVSGRSVAALALFAVAAWTDILDGAAARRFHSNTKAGAYFDPIADKCLLSGVFLALAATRPRALVGGRDHFRTRPLYSAGGAVLMQFTPIRKFPPSVWGKLSTFVQIPDSGAVDGRDFSRPSVLDAVSAAMLWLCVAFAAWSGIHYTWRGVRLMQTAGITRSTLTGRATGVVLNERQGRTMTRYLPARQYLWFGITAVVLAALVRLVCVALHSTGVHSGRAVRVERGISVCSWRFVRRSRSTRDILR